ncbi:MAG: hypothetical protein AAF560_05340, partial [Acidobacteriota bacterium]
MTQADPSIAAPDGQDTQSHHPVLSVENLSKRYGAVQALDDVSLEADQEILGLVGANGAGKSTLYRS